MKHLKDYVELQKLTGMSDKEMILAYFVDNDIEEEAMEIFYDLANAKIRKMKSREHEVKTWVYTIPSDYLYEEYPVKIATMLHRIELDYIVNGEVTNNRLKWAKENVPNTKMPTLYFQPCLEWMEKQGIKFKDAERIKL